MPSAGGTSIQSTCPERNAARREFGSGSQAAVGFPGDYTGKCKPR